MGIDIQVEILKNWETLGLVLGKILAFQYHGGINN
jgi:hypothetical protein